MKFKTSIKRRISGRHKACLIMDDFEDKKIAIVSVDPSKRKTGGALLGDRIRMNSVNSDRVYMRSLATRQSNLALSKHVPEIISILKYAGFDFIVLETSGIGQSDTEIVGLCDTSLYVMTPDYGAATQLEKIDMLDYADLVAINKFDKEGATDALRDVRKQYRRNNLLWDSKDEELPVYGTIASMFNDPGVDDLYRAAIKTISNKRVSPLISKYEGNSKSNAEKCIIPPKRTRYLSEITEAIHDYNIWVSRQAEAAQKLYGLKKVIDSLTDDETSNEARRVLGDLYQKTSKELDPDNWKILEDWNNKLERYHNDIYVYKVRDREIKTETYTNSLSMNRIPRISLPAYKGYGDILKWSLQENVPGEFPYTAGRIRLPSEPYRSKAQAVCSSPFPRCRRYCGVRPKECEESLSSGRLSCSWQGYCLGYRPHGASGQEVWNHPVDGSCF